jgi:two-component system LytT family sensor kinase
MRLPKLQGKNIQILLHIAAWIVLLGLPFYNLNRWNVPNEFVWAYYINVIIDGIIFYGNYLILIPWFFFGKRRAVYYLSTVVLTLLMFFMSHMAFSFVFNMESRNRPSDVNTKTRIERREVSHPPRGRRFFGPFGPMHFYNFMFVALGITIFAIGLRSLERHSQIEKRQKELEKEKLNSELALLKNQISPHFFFNTLNNIYSLISINTEDSQKAILKLSKLMRYLLYETEQGQTKLSNDIDFMNNYIDLMRLRMSNKVNLHVDFPSECPGITIPPLLFIPFIENAFKHGISYRDKSFIDIRMNVTEDLISFSCSNSILRPNDESGSQHTGIGLENVNKRLNLLFPGKHELKIKKTSSTFDVILNITIK